MELKMMCLVLLTDHMYQKQQSNQYAFHDDAVARWFAVDGKDTTKSVYFSLMQMMMF